jgi:anti-sigma regulatory factor (Ser/Thr protein kinase)
MDDREIRLDLTDLSWVHNFLFVPLAALIDLLKSSGYAIQIVSPTASEVMSYLRALRFELGLCPVEESAWIQELAKYRNKRYIPIIKFPISSQFELIRDASISQVNRILYEQIGLSGDFRNAVLYLIDEGVNNVVQHSRSRNGWISAQYFPTKKYLDLKIVDTGITILGSFEAHKVAGVSSDAEAIKAALNGISTKIEDDNRGFGMRTSRRMLVEGLSGFYCIFSGYGLLLNRRLYKIPVRWPGTVVCMRIPNPLRNFSFYSYV